MKKQIRMYVFETNSSSTHSLQIHKQTLDEANDMVVERIKKAYESRYPEENKCSPYEYIDNGILTLRGLYFESGDEEGNIYYIVNSWMAKLQYLAMHIFSSASSVEGFDCEASRNYGYYDDHTSELLQKTEVYQMFKKMIIDYVNSKTEFKITDVVLDMQHSVWIEPITTDEKTYYDETITKDYFADMFNKVMYDDCIITYADEAYHPYSAPETYIL